MFHGQLCPEKLFVGVVIQMEALSPVSQFSKEEKSEQDESTDDKHKSFHSLGQTKG